MFSLRIKWSPFALLVLAVLLPACSTTTGLPGAEAATIVNSPSPVFTLMAPTPTASPSLQPSATMPPATATATRSPTPTAAPSATATATATLGPTPDAQAASRQVRLPILMYHYVEPWPADAGELRQGLTVQPEDFAVQMAYLHDQGYVTVSLYDLVYALALGTPLPSKAVVVTFDDGYRTLMDSAVPTMQHYGFTGTVFVITQLMDEDFPQYLTWEQAEGLYAQGWKIEPHTKTHEQLAGRGRAFQLYQMLGSMQTVEAHIGQTPRFMAYPSGQYDELTVELAREMHLWGAVTVDFGRVHTLASLYTLHRVRVTGQETLSAFVTALEG